MAQPNQQDRTDNSSQSNQAKDKENPQNLKKSGVENSQDQGRQNQDSMDKHLNKAGNEDHDVDEGTNVNQRSGNAERGAQRQEPGQNSQWNEPGKQHPENPDAGRQQQFNAEKDEDTASNRNTQPSRMGQADKNSQSNSDSDRGSDRKSGNSDQKTSK